MRKIRKKGDMTLKEVLRLVLAALSIFFLILLAVLVSGILIKKNKIEQARASLNDIVGKLNTLSAGESKDYIYTAPLEWYLIFFETQAPAACRNSLCLCICDDDSAERCDKNGVCKIVFVAIELKSDGVDDKSIEIEKLSDIKISKNPNFEINVVQK